MTNKVELNILEQISKALIGRDSNAEQLNMMFRVVNDVERYLRTTRDTELNSTLVAQKRSIRRQLEDLRLLPTTLTEARLEVMNQEELELLKKDIIQAGTDAREEADLERCNQLLESHKIVMKKLDILLQNV